MLPVDHWCPLGPSKCHPRPDPVSTTRPRPPEADEGRGPVEGSGRTIGLAIVLGANPLPASGAPAPTAPAHPLDHEAALAGDGQEAWAISGVAGALSLGEVGPPGRGSDGRAGDK